MRYTIIENNIATNVCNGNPEFVYGADMALLFVEVPDTVEDGYVLINSIWTNPNEPKVYTVEELRIASIPQSVTKVQAMRAMKQTDVDAVANTSMWTNFQALLASNADANDEWVLALDLQRNHPLVLALTPTLGKTGTQIDDLFILASAL